MGLDLMDGKGDQQLDSLDRLFTWFNSVTQEEPVVIERRIEAAKVK